MGLDFHIQNNDNLLPRDQVKIERVEATPYPDGRRVNVIVEVTPFRERPNLEITITDSSEKTAAVTSVIEAMTFTMAFTLHLRGAADASGQYRLGVALYYDTPGSPQDTCEVALHIPSAQPGPGSTTDNKTSL
ncbi:MAG: hypothetical protein JW966_06395 [Anaerolineae bacterium]|nr:hypothetical protein [Anaerolineae bacterium]